MIWRSGLTYCEFYSYDMCVEHTEVYQACVGYPNDEVDNVDSDIDFDDDGDDDDGNEGEGEPGGRS